MGLTRPSIDHNCSGGTTYQRASIAAQIKEIKAIRRVFVSKPINGPHSHAPMATIANKTPAKYCNGNRKIAAIAKGAKIKAVNIRCFNKRGSF